MAITAIREMRERLGAFVDGVKAENSGDRVKGIIVNLFARLPLEEARLEAEQTINEFLFKIAGNGKSQEIGNELKGFVAELAQKKFQEIFGEYQEKVRETAQTILDDFSGSLEKGNIPKTLAAKKGKMVDKLRLIEPPVQRGFETILGPKIVELAKNMNSQALNAQIARTTRVFKEFEGETRELAHALKTARTNLQALVGNARGQEIFEGIVTKELPTAMSATQNATKIAKRVTDSLENYNPAQKDQLRDKIATARGNLEEMRRTVDALRNNSESVDKAMPKLGANTLIEKMEKRFLDLTVSLNAAAQTVDRFEKLEGAFETGKLNDVKINSFNGATTHLFEKLKKIIVTQSDSNKNPEARLYKRAVVRWLEGISNEIAEKLRDNALKFTRFEKFLNFFTWLRSLFSSNNQPKAIEIN
jgi:hypothetical protein